MNQTEAALNHLAEVHGLAVAHFNIGCLLHRRGETEAAKEQFARALERDPNLAPARQMLAQTIASYPPVPGGAPLSADHLRSSHRPMPDVASNAVISRGPVPRESAVAATTVHNDYAYSNYANVNADRPSGAIPGNPAADSAAREMIHMPKREAKMPAQDSVFHAPLPQGESFIYSNSVLQPLPPVGP